MRYYKCTLCGDAATTRSFKGGYICEECTAYLKGLPLNGN